MNKPKYVWYVRNHYAGRVIFCELQLNDVIRYVIVGVWPWEKRQSPTPLIAQMGKDALKAMFYIQVNAAIKPAHEVTHETKH